MQSCGMTTKSYSHYIYFYCTPNGLEYVRDKLILNRNIYSCIFSFIIESSTWASPGVVQRVWTNPRFGRIKMFLWLAKYCGSFL